MAENNTEDEKIKEAVADNANTNAIRTAEHSINHPVVKIIAGVDDALGGELSDIAGHGLTKVNEVAPLGNTAQNILNTVGNSKALETAGSAMAAKNGGGASEAAKEGAAAAGTTAAKGAENAAKGAENAAKGAENAAKKGTNPTDAAKQVADAPEGIADTDGLKDKVEGLEDKANPEKNTLDTSSNSGSSNKEGTVKGIIDFALDKKTIGFLLALPIILILVSLIIPFAAIIIKLQPIMNVQNTVTNRIDYVKDLVTNGKQSRKEKNFYNKLVKLQKSYKPGVCIDINLITSALTIQTDINQSINPDENVDQDFDENDLEMDFSRMTKNIKLLAKMQLTHKKYILPESGDYCREGGDEVLVKSGEYDSSKAEYIAQHDDDKLLAKFFNRDDVNEQNYVYYYYYSDYMKDTDGNYKKDKNGNKICYDKDTINHQISVMNTASKKRHMINIGTYETMENSVFYWNLVNSFIPDYYEKMLPSKEAEKDKRIKQIASEIYLLYKYVGNGQNCSNTSASSIAFGDSDLCVGGVKVSDGDGNIVSVVPLEEYVAGVVQGEIGGYMDYVGIEALKAQAVAARTYVLSLTGNCSSSIINSSANQNYAPASNPKAIEAAVSTAGELLYNNGNIFLSEYDSWYCEESNTCTYTKLPLHETHTLTLSKYNGWAAGGHGRGMSQILSFQLADEGMDYQSILKTFYSSGTTIVQASQNNSGVVVSTGTNTFYAEEVGPWSSWRQSGQPWSGLSMPNPHDNIYKDGKLVNGKCTTIADCGCAITSLAILIARSGVETTLGENFNPGSFYLAIKDGGGMSGNGILWGPAANVVTSHLRLIDTPAFISEDQIRSYMSSGKFVIAGVKNGGHWVALTGLDGDGTIWMTDPGVKGNAPLMEKWKGTITTLIVFEVV